MSHKFRFIIKAVQRHPDRTQIERKINGEISFESEGPVDVYRATMAALRTCNAHLFEIPADALQITIRRAKR